jgi:serine/threonine protein kinase
MITDHSSPELSLDSPTELDTQSQINIYKNPIYIKTLFEAKISVNLVLLPSTNQQVALKIFQYNQDRISDYFLNEIRFSNLHHNNIISITHYDILIETPTPNRKKKTKSSQIFMEYAPYGDLFELINTIKAVFDEKLTRTYFHHIIDGLDYLHSNGVAHLDIKPENLLIGDNFQMKITDFDLSYCKGDGFIQSYGTCDYRPPELLHGKCEDPFAADIFSAGIILFYMMTQGVLPQSENDYKRNLSLYDLLIYNNSIFWECHTAALRKDPKFFSEDFRELFNSMTLDKPEQRANISDIKKTNWYKGEIYTADELRHLMADYFCPPDKKLDE